MRNNTSSNNNFWWFLVEVPNKSRMIAQLKIKYVHPECIEEVVVVRHDAKLQELAKTSSSSKSPRNSPGVCLIVVVISI